MHKLERTKKNGVVLAGRPYYVDPEIHHGIPEVLNSYGLSVLTEDSLPGNRWQYSTWEYPDRICTAAEYINGHSNLDFIELHSFGCGLDALTVEQARKILSRNGKVCTSLKIDEMVDLAAVKIRIRSMMSLGDQKNENTAQKESRV